MRVNSYRRWLAFLWVAGFVLAFLEALYLRLVEGIGPTATKKLFEAVFVQYTPYLLTIIAFVFWDKSPRHPSTTRRSLSYGFAMVFSALWNLVVLVVLFEACVDSGRTEDALSNLQAIIPKLTAFTVPAVAYFFGQQPGARE